MCLSLGALVTDRSDYAQIAADCGSLTAIANGLVSITPETVEWDDEEAASSYILREVRAERSFTLKPSLSDLLGIAHRDDFPGTPRRIESTDAGVQVGLHGRAACLASAS